MSQETNLEMYNSKIRRSFDHNSEEWFFSVVDVIALATNSSDARNYWKVLKNRLKKTQNQLVTSCNPLKMEALDGKYYLTDTGNASTILKILAIVSEEDIPYFETYFSSLGHPKSENVVSLMARKFEPQKAYLKIEKNTELSYPHTEIKDADFIISVDLYRTKNTLILEAFVAGVSLSDLEITATCQTLTIRGHREFTNKAKMQDYHSQEISWGKFYRHINLPYEICIDKVEALDDRGLISIRMPIINKSYTRRVRVL